MNCADTWGKFVEPKNPPSIVRAPPDGTPFAVWGKLSGEVEISAGRSATTSILKGPPLESGVQVVAPIFGLQMLIVCVPDLTS